MSDEGMRGLQARFQAAARMPRGLSADVERQARRRLALTVMLGLLVLGETAVGVAVLATDDSAHGRVIGGFLIGVSLLLVLIFAPVLGRRVRHPELTPDALLARMAERLEAGKRLGRIAPWLASAVALGTAGIVLSADVPAGSKALGVAFSALVAVFGGVMPRVARARLAARTALLERWRAELASGPDA